MALDEQKKQLFIQTATQQGFGEDEITSFLSEAEKVLTDGLPTGDQTFDSTKGKSIAQIYGESGRQSELDELSASGSLPSDFNVAPSGISDDVFSPTENLPDVIQQRVRGGMSLKSGGVQGGMSLAPQSQLQASSPQFAEATKGSGVQSQGIVSHRGMSQAFGNKNSIEVFSDGINNGVDFKTEPGTPVKLPPGNWEVIESFGGATRQGFVGNGDNNGYGNSVMVRNRLTGEKIRFSHLSKVGVRPGQLVDGGSTIALTGHTGNSSGPHLDVEYRNAGGQLADVMRSSYGTYF